ncbi:hypothetical protein GFH48_05960 [Streptomyces fagopyri]|uniref:Uncharacterized protein n=1 Tax=Streptomyces fagopyri TaxID=2662397 RepID=A0A5Q0L704_9ACTN|nr:hypothetical protein [Streptomyces fagopyri]QFZ72875.1 hypothetical protein GFH48_05960 [Streptomyces fagopyri]
MAFRHAAPHTSTARSPAPGPPGGSLDAASLGRLLGACAAGRANGLSPQLVADLAASCAPAGDPARRDVPVLRVVVLRAGADAAGLVPLLTGIRPPEPPAATDVVPLLHAHHPVIEPELRITEGHRRSLDRLARRLLRDSVTAGAARAAGTDRYGTVTWLRIRAEQGRDRFFATRWTGEDAVARAWRRIQDVTAAGTQPTIRAVASTPDASDTPDATDATDGPDVPATLSTAFAGSPLPWPPAGEGVRVTVTDVPVPAEGALAPYAREILDSAHLVLAAAPHRQLAGREPLSAGFRALLAGSVGGPCRPPVALVSCVAEHGGADFLAGLVGWLRGALPHTVGPFTRGLPVHAVSPRRAEDALRVLLRPVDRAAPVRARALELWAASGLPVLCASVLAPALRDPRASTAGLGVRRFRAALHDIRLDGYDVPPGAARAPAPATAVLAPDVPARQLWDELDRFAAIPLARRAARRPYPAAGPDGPPHDAPSRGDIGP